MLMQHIYISYNFLHYKSTSNIVFDIIFINIKTGTAILKKAIPVTGSIY